VPPLRERREEIPDLVTHFISEANVRLGRGIRRVSADAMAALMEYDWPGNVRELRNAIERATVVTDGEVIALAGLPPAIQAVAGRRGTAINAEQWAAVAALSLDDRMTQLERAFVLDALSQAGGVQAAAARVLGVTERSMWHLVKKHRIDVDRIKERAAAEQAE